jgi:hypothetical protein
VAGKAKNFVTDPWSVEIDGLVEKPRRLDLAELLKIETKERIYRFRCVEGWSMVIPWVGFPLSSFPHCLGSLSRRLRLPMLPSRPVTMCDRCPIPSMPASSCPTS